MPTPPAETLRRHTAAANLIKLRGLDDVLPAFAQRGVPCVLLKGAALLLTVYDHPGDRPMTDIDLWTPFHGLDAAEEILLPLGFAPAPGRPGVYARGDLRLDVATDIWYLPPGDVKPVWDRRRQTPGGPATLSSEDAFLYCVAHGMIHHGQWEDRWTEDLRKLAAAPGFDWTRLAADARRWGLAEALWETHARAPTLLPAETARTIEGERRTLRGRVLQALSRTEVSGKGHLLRFLLLRSAGAKARFLRRQFFPPAVFLRRRYHGPALFLYLLRPLFLFAALARFFRRASR